MYVYWSGVADRFFLFDIWNYQKEKIGLAMPDYYVHVVVYTVHVISQKLILMVRAGASNLCGVLRPTTS